MADNSLLNAGSGGDTYRSKDRGGAPAVKTQIVALDLAPGGAETLMNGVMPVSDNGGSLTVDGAVSLAAAVPAGTNNIGDVDVLSLPAATLAGGAKQELDYDTGAGTQATQILGIALPASGGPVGVSATNPLPTRENGATTSLANVASSATSVTALAANANRLRAWLYNDSTQPVNVKYGATASASSFTKRLLPNEFHVVEGYTGVIDAIWDSANGNMRVTELTP